MKRDQQALLFRFTDKGAPEVPLQLSGWRLLSYSVKGCTETGLYFLARYVRP